MGRIKINDLSEDQPISKDEMRKVFGGIIVINDMPFPSTYLQQPSLGTVGVLPLPMPYPRGFRSALPEPIP